MPIADRGGHSSTAIWMLAGYTTTNRAAAAHAPRRAVRGLAMASAVASSATPLMFTQNRSDPGARAARCARRTAGSRKWVTPAVAMKAASRSAAAITSRTGTLRFADGSLRGHRLGVGDRPRRAGAPRERRPPRVRRRPATSWPASPRLPPTWPRRPAAKPRSTPPATWCVRAEGAALDGVVTCAGVGPTVPDAAAPSWRSTTSARPSCSMGCGRCCAGTDPSAVAIASNSATTVPGVPDALVAACVAGDEERASASRPGIDPSVAYAASKLAVTRLVRTARRRPALGRFGHPPQRRRPRRDRDAVAPTGSRRPGARRAHPRLPHPDRRLRHAGADRRRDRVPVGRPGGGVRVRLGVVRRRRDRRPRARRRHPHAALPNSNWRWLAGSVSRRAQWVIATSRLWGCGDGGSESAVVGGAGGVGGGGSGSDSG